MCRGGHAQIAAALGLSTDEVDIIAAGQNHHTWYISVKVGGVEKVDELYEKMSAMEICRKNEISVLM